MEGQEQGWQPVVLGGLEEDTGGPALLSPVTWTQKGSIYL